MHRTTLLFLHLGGMSSHYSARRALSIINKTHFSAHYACRSYKFTTRTLMAYSNFAACAQTKTHMHKTPEQRCHYIIHENLLLREPIFRVMPILRLCVVICRRALFFALLTLTPCSLQQQHKYTCMRATKLQTRRNPSKGTALRC
jgi:hypothetical protein